MKQHLNLTWFNSTVSRIWQLLNTHFQLLSLILLSATFSACQPETPVASETAAAPSVKTATLADLATPIKYSAPASAFSKNTSLLKAEISARIDAVLVQTGETVTDNQVLIELNCDDVKAELKQAIAYVHASEARAKQSKEDYVRAEKLYQSGHITKEALSRAHTEVDIAKAEQEANQSQVMLQRNRRERCQIKAPYRGVVTERLAQIGELATPGSPLIELVDNTTIEIRAGVAIETAPSLLQAQTIVFSSVAGKYPVKLRTLNSVINSTGHAQEAYLVANDTPPLAGTIGRITWSSEETTIPADLLNEYNGELGVYILTEDNIAKFIALPNAQAGRANLTTLPTTTRIITSGRHAVKDGHHYQPQP